MFSYILCPLFIICVCKEMNLQPIKEEDRTILNDFASFSGVTMTLSCGLQPFASLTKPLFTNRTNFEDIHILACLLPEVSYAYVFENLNINVSYIQKLTIFELPHESKLNGTHFEGLELRQISIKCLETDTLLHVQNDVLETLKYAEMMTFENVMLSPMPADTRVVVVILERGRSEGIWGGCSNLRALLISRWDVSAFSRNWLSHCTKLRKVWLYRMPSIYTIIWVLEGARSLEEVYIEDCDLYILKSDMFLHANNLKKLHVIRTNVQIISFTFNNKTVLEELNLSNNKLDDNENTLKQFYKLPALQILNLDKNSLPNFCNFIYSSVPLPVKYLSLSSTETSRLCFANWTNLVRLDMSRNKINTFEIMHLPVNKNGTIEVDLRGNPIQKVNFGKEHYEQLKSNTTAKLTVKMDSRLDCDCHGAWFARALKEKIVSFNDVRCADDVLMILAEPSRLECDKFVCGDMFHSCTCRHSWNDNSTRADCKSRELRKLPRVPELTEMHASNNLIETILIEDLSDTLIFLDLYDNRVARVDASVAETLFAIPKRRVRLSSNPLVCDCDNKLFLDALKDHHSQVVDYSNITCVGGDTALQDLDTERLCNAKESVLLIALPATGGMLLGLAALIGALYCRYGQSIKIFLYARGICLCCMAEDELDAYRQYDAFISFAHDDERFVVEELLPELEKTYKICIHLRDWIVGDMIPTQITRSVVSSRRTIVVLSKKFVKSLWGLLEFRTAHVSALSEGRVRVIVVVIDDVTEDDTLDLQLRGYLLTNTYLKWGDPWFWDKLKYAMPRTESIKTANSSQLSATQLGNDAVNVNNIPVVEMRMLPPPS